MDDDKPDELTNKVMGNFKDNMQKTFTKEHLVEFVKCYFWIPFTWFAFFIVGVYIGQEWMETSCVSAIQEHCSINKIDTPQFNDAIEDGVVKNMISIPVNKIDKVIDNGD